MTQERLVILVERFRILVRMAHRIALGTMILVTYHVNAAEASDAYAVKAAYIYNIAKFVQWPTTVFASPTSPLNLCILGRTDLDDALSKMAENTVKGRTLVIKHYSDEQFTQNCHILFISPTKQPLLTPIINTLANRPVLTVSDMEHFSQRGGMITLFQAGQRIRFTINAGAVQRAGLKISSKLLRLARIVAEMPTEEER